MAGVLKVKDINDPSGNTWINISSVGARGPTGPVGPTGPPGPTGPLNTSLEEVHVGTAPPDLAAQPYIELWYDPDEVAPLGPMNWPPGGTTDQALVKLSDADADVSWRGPYLSTVAGGTVTGDIVVNGDTAVVGTLTSPTVIGDVHFDGAISAQSVTDRSAYTWEVIDLTPSLAPNWDSADFQSGAFPGMIAAYRNRYSVSLMMAVHRVPGTWVEDTWLDVLNPGSLPVGYRPGFDLWDTRMSVETDESGSLFEIRVTNTGSVQVNMKGFTLDWQDDTRIPIQFGYPRSA